MRRHISRQYLKFWVLTKQRPCLGLALAVLLRTMQRMTSEKAQYPMRSLMRGCTVQGRDLAGALISIAGLGQNWI